MDNQFIWRPSDNSDRTRLRYGLEAEHWLNALGEAQRKRKHVSLRETSSILVLLTSFVINVLLLLTILLIKLIKWLNYNFFEEEKILFQKNKNN